MTKSKRRYAPKARSDLTLWKRGTCAKCEREANLNKNGHCKICGK